MTTGPLEYCTFLAPPLRFTGALAMVVPFACAVACSSSPSDSANGSGGVSAAGQPSTSSDAESNGGSSEAQQSQSGGARASGGTSSRSAGGSSATPSGGASPIATTTGGSNSTGGKGSSVGGTKSTSGATATGGVSTSTGAVGGASSSGRTVNTGGRVNTGGANASGGQSNSAGTVSTGGSAAAGGSSSTVVSTTGGTTSGGCASGPVGTFTGEVATGIKFMDTDGNPVNAHGGGIIKVGDTYYLHGEYFLSTTTNNYFNGFSMYSSKDLSTWKNEGIILPQQASGELGPDRIGERPHIIKCPSTGEFVLYAHAASTDYQTDKEVVYATSTTVNGTYTYKGPLTDAKGTTASHSDMSAFTDGDAAYVITESGYVYTLATDCHSWTERAANSAVNGTSGGIESPTVFKKDGTYYWVGSHKTGWRANNNFYSTAPSMKGPWTWQGYIAPVADTADKLSAERTWLSQSTWVQPVQGCQGTVYVYWGDHWYGTEDTKNPGKHNDQATYVVQPLVFGATVLMPTYYSNWTLDVAQGTWSH